MKKYFKPILILAAIAIGAFMYYKKKFASAKTATVTIPGIGDIAAPLPGGAAPPVIPDVNVSLAVEQAKLYNQPVDVQAAFPDANPLPTPISKFPIYNSDNDIYKTPGIMGVKMEY